MNEKEANRIANVLYGFFTLQPAKMKRADQLLYLSIMLKFVDAIEPLVKEYGLSEEELREAITKQENETKFKDIASAILVKAMMDQQIDDKDEDND